MDWKRIAPWNWFKDEETSRSSVGRPVHDRHTPHTPGDFERLFEEAARRFFSEDATPAAQPIASAAPQRPVVDISEGKKAYTVRAELPGVDRDDISVEAEDHTLVIRAEKRREQEDDDEEGYHWVERSYGAVQRVLSLPENADVEAIGAQFKNGVLELRIPKHAGKVAGGRSIEIQRG